MTVDFVVINASVFFRVEVSSHSFGIPCEHKVISSCFFMCACVCRTARTLCLTQFAEIMSYASCVRLILGCVDICSYGTLFFTIP